MQLRKLPKELQEKAEKELNEVPSRVEDDLNKIREWISTQPHLKARTEDQWLIHFLRGCKFSLEKTKQKLDLFYSCKTLMPELFANRDPFDPKMQEILRMGYCIPVTDRSNITSPVYFLNFYHLTEKQNAFDAAKLELMSLEIVLMEEDGVIINGIHDMEDLSQLCLPYATQITPSLLKKFLTCIQDMYPIRLNRIVMRNAPSFFESILRLIRLLLKEKMRNRIVMVNKNNVDELYEHIPRKLLPKDCGGENSSIAELAAEWKKKVESYREWFLDDAKYGSDESKRPGKPRSASELFGVEGSFRKLDLD